MSFFHRLTLTTALAACGLALWSCTPDKPPETPAPDPSKIKASFFPSEDRLTAPDAIPDQPYLIQLATYQITVPAGAVSRSEEFWKHIDEHVVDVPTYELLFKNGVRVGVAGAAEWDYLKDILKQYPAITQPSGYAGREVRDIELELKMQVPYQNLFYYDTRGDLIGRTFERCDNLLRVSFQPAPRKPGTVRLGLCPVIRSLRERVVAVGDVNTRTYEFIHPEQLFELNLTADIPLDSFLVVAPSEEGKWPTSLGSNFLIGDGATEQVETLIVFRPVTYRQRVGVKNMATTRP